MHHHHHHSSGLVPRGSGMKETAAAKFERQHMDSPDLGTDDDDKAMGHVLQLESASDKAHYILSKDGNRNNWYIGRGSDNNNDCTFHSYVHGTTLTLKQDYAVVNKHFHVGQAVVATDGNIQGTKWGGKWLDAYLRDSFVAKSKAWTQVWSGSAGGGVSVTVSQDLRFRNIWIKCANNSWNFFRTGPDGIYFIASDGGWLRFQIHSNGLGFKNIADSRSVPNAIMVENE
uniref:TAIL FIBER PROTEIN n=1 Tax=Escherichia phage T7 TaxID=10760 RepID=UPI0009468D1A|nr:Chain A, TAIL FIBER PROTEIN [Escherichia phage T7]4A0U_B Chain B, TAIL FIBER PROTEIN [Escherichia phage T7]4A0U_C Chain C, TAIL FIBER PROTEIN [Escherichia phage T7]